MHAHTFAPLFLTLALPAQVDTAPAESKPATATIAPLFTLELRGPATMVNQLRPTNLGTMLSSAKGEALWRDAVAGFTSEWQKLHGDDATFAAARNRVLAYAGRVRVAAWVAPAADARRVEPESVAAIFDADGKTDLAALGKDIARWIGRGKQGKVEDGKLGELAVQLVQDELGTFATGLLPDGRLLVVGSEKPDAATAAVARCQAAFLPNQAAKPSDPLIVLRIDLQQAVAGQMRRDREMAPLGFGSLRQFEMLLQPRGPRVQVEMNVGFVGPRGMFAAFFPEHAGIPALFGWAPQSSLAVKVGRFDLQPLWDAAMAMLKEMNRDGEDASERAREFFGVDVAKDLLPHITDEILLCWDPGKPTAQRHPDIPVLAVMRLKDAKAATKALSTMLDKVGIGSVEVDGVWRTKDNGFGRWVDLAVRGDQLLVSFDDGDRSAADGFLAHQPTAAELPAAVKELEKAMPPGCNGAGIVDVHTALRDHVGLFFDIVGDLAFGLPPLPDNATTREALVALAPALAEHHLDRVITLSGTKDGRWVFRVLW